MKLAAHSLLVELRLLPDSCLIDAVSDTDLSLIRTSQPLSPAHVIRSALMLYFDVIVTSLFAVS